MKYACLRQKVQYSNSLHVQVQENDAWKTVDKTH